jgi:hypothetical protein
MQSLRPYLTVFAAVAALLLVPGRAAALSPVTTDCNAHNKLTRSYSVSELRSALATMPADVKEYTSCYQVIQDELYRKLGQRPPSGSGTGSSGGGSSSFLSTPVLIVLIVVILLGGILAFIASKRGEGGGPPPTGRPGGGNAAT